MVHSGMHVSSLTPPKLTQSKHGSESTFLVGEERLTQEIHPCPTLRRILASLMMAKLITGSPWDSPRRGSARPSPSRTRIRPGLADETPDRPPRGPGTASRGSRSSVLPIIETKNPAKAMVFGLFTSNERLMPPYNFLPKGRLNAYVYIELLQTAVLSCLASHYPLNTIFMLILDTAPAHLSKKSIAFLEKHVDRVVKPDVWPSNSPHLNPWDY
ncbi:unnamed protein product [Lepeophtheirus salmonis]|uniref:(salmon louse) hypothetical protein n=1 Tax=Lepeophtheirus salmonis TaxID=72036 RepID=A0A7R8CXK0_LEPSM|nr:unnamed protein product [Lepeophtheirus salmonis]CAF2960636.1 unnamed protein product [Lepeophtheirus salmonis]